MGLWRKSGKTLMPATRFPGVAEAAISGASLFDLCGVVYSALASELAEHHVERFGVWISSGPAGEEPSNFESLQGRCWNNGREDGPPEWSTLAPDARLPSALFHTVTPVLQDADAEPAVFAPGVASAMRRLVWVPVWVGARLRGLIFAATRKPHAELPVSALQRSASELALAVGFRSATMASSANASELAFARKISDEIIRNAANLPLDRMLEQIVHRPVARIVDGQPMATFAMIGVRPGRIFPHSPGDAPVEFRWTAGDKLRARSAMSDLLSDLWMSAMEKGETVGQFAQAPWPSYGVSRVVAVPLFVSDEPAGVLVAGLQNSAATLANLERLELHARLASIALTLSVRGEQPVMTMDLVDFFLQHAGSPLFLLNADLEVTAASAPGRKLLIQARPAATRNEESRGESETDFRGSAERLFRPQEWRRLAGWMLELTQSGRPGVAKSAEAELHTGRRTALQAVTLHDGRLLLMMEQPAEPAIEAECAINVLRSLTEWLDQGIVIFDQEDRVRSANLHFAHYFGLSSSDLESAHTLSDLIGLAAPRVAEPAHFAEDWQEAARVAQRGTHQEIQVVRPAPRLVERASHPVLDSRGARTGRIEIYRDLTAQQLLQSKLRTNERLAALGERVSGIAHELSNPLTTIIGYAQRALARQDVSLRREELQRIFFEADRAASILRQLLASTRETAGERRPLSLNSLILRTVDLHRFQLASEQIRVELDLARSLPAMAGDAGQLQQVLVNLIENSRHALLEQHRAGTISFQTSTSDSGRVLLQVSDTGPGIPEALRNRVFDPFFTTKPSGLGTGLGLSIVAGLVRQHGGHIRLAQRPGSGATFVMDFPAAAAEGPQLLPSLPAAISSAPPAAHGETVLIVEDEPTVAQLIADLLSDLGYASDVQQDSRRALVAALNREYALVVCDMKMPGLDGQHFYGALREAGSPLVGKFLFVTGDVLNAGTREFLRQNRLTHVAKPFRMEEFTEKATLILNRIATDAEPSPDLSPNTLTSHG